VIRCSSFLIEVIYQSESIIAVSKPAGMIVHRGWGLDNETVADVVRDQITGCPVHAIHRLDRGTSGVLLFAKNAETARHLQSEMDNGHFHKTYIALVRGPMQEDCVVDHPVPKEKSKSSKRVPACTKFTVLSHKDRWTLVLAEPITGRLHQIRRHLKHLSHPIIGDVRYGKGEINRFFQSEYGLTRMSLHACQVEVPDLEGRILTLSAKMPDDLIHPLSKLGIEIPERFCNF
jgi:tRNA pseudouridine65 synthase